MKNDPEYIKTLEDTILRLLPVYNEYQRITGKKLPSIKNPVKIVKIPALFKRGF